MNSRSNVLHQKKQCFFDMMSFGERFDDWIGDTMHEFVYGVMKVCVWMKDAAIGLLEYETYSTVYWYQV